MVVTSYPKCPSDLVCQKSLESDQRRIIQRKKGNKCMLALHKSKSFLTCVMQGDFILIPNGGKCQVGSLRSHLHCLLIGHWTLPVRWRHRQHAMCKFQRSGLCAAKQCFTNCFVHTSLILYWLYGSTMNQYTHTKWYLKPYAKIWQSCPKTLLQSHLWGIMLEQ